MIMGMPLPAPSRPRPLIKPPIDFFEGERHIGYLPRIGQQDKAEAKTKKTYNTGDSLVVTDPTTNPALRSLTLGEQTGSRIFYELWSYVLGESINRHMFPHY